LEESETTRRKEMGEEKREGHSSHLCTTQCLNLETLYVHILVIAGSTKELHASSFLLV
jgi:hypothetical protein